MVYSYLVYIFIHGRSPWVPLVQDEICCLISGFTSWDVTYHVTSEAIGHNNIMLACTYSICTVALHNYVFMHVHVHVHACAH